MHAMGEGSGWPLLCACWKQAARALGSMLSDAALCCGATAASQSVGLGSLGVQRERRATTLSGGADVL